MKKYLMWTFERGSRPYDVICVVILAVIFFTPPSAFHDRPHLIKVSDQAIRQTNDADGKPFYVVEQVRTEQDAVDRLKASLGDTVTVSRTEPVYDAAGQLVAYSIWLQR
jgi:hypothetical protein